MKEVNLLSIVQAYSGLNEELFSKYLDYFKVSIKRDEVRDLQLLTDTLQKINQDISLYDKFFFGYTIPQISKEFDLLKFGEDCVINIELKRTSDEDKIKKQLIQNKHYLSFLNVDIHNYTFVSDVKKIFRLDENDNLIEEQFDELSKALMSQKVKSIDDINTIFNPSNYLISPFNSTEDFIAGNYFLTTQQDTIKDNTLKKMKESETNFISISGKAGTGKTLLIYDIAKHCISKKSKVLIIHCGKLNDGHIKLRNDYCWDIISIKYLKNERLGRYSLIIIDETQRIYPYQLDSIISQVKFNDLTCIFSYDKQQCLSKGEIINDIEEHIHNKTESKKYTLTKKIRTNKEIASFIHSVFNKNERIENLNRSNIELSYFKEYFEAKNYLQLLKDKNWKVINFTPSKNHNPYSDFFLIDEDNVHGVIGQEFDKVVAVVDSHFYYNEKNKLSTKDYPKHPYYHPSKMLFQIVTRTRKKISFVIIDNDEIMTRCLSILSSN